MAGLLAARVLADHFEQVILLERDKFPPPGSNRKGVPQGKHTHVLLERGRQIMEKYLPGLTEDLIQLGANRIADASQDIAWFQSGQFHRPGASGISGIGVSRPTLESVVRTHVLSLPNVHCVEKCNVTGLITTADKSRVTGVQRILSEHNNTEETMTADLVVDAGGRGSRSPKWLETLGYRQPQVEEVKIGLGYTSCFYHRERAHMPGHDGIVFLTTPPNKRLGVMLAQDGNRWVVTLGGYLGDHVPTNYPEFIESAKNLPAPDIYNIIKDTKLLSGPEAYKFTANLWRHYEKLTLFPEGFLVFGDALCSFNPIYGQGMTVAAMESEVLDACLIKGEKKIAERFFAKVSKIISPSWDTAVGSDLSFAEVEGHRTPLVRFLNWYISKLHLAAHHDAEVSIAFLKVINMTAPPPSILHPKILWRVIRGNFNRGTKAQILDAEKADHAIDQVESFS